MAHPHGCKSILYLLLRCGRVSTGFDGKVFHSTDSIHENLFSTQRSLQAALCRSVDVTGKYFTLVYRRLSFRGDRGFGTENPGCLPQ